METDEETLPDTGFNDIDFGCGKRQNDGILSVHWPAGAYLKLQKHDGYIFTRQIFKKMTTSF